MAEEAEGAEATPDAAPAAEGAEATPEVEATSTGEGTESNSEDTATVEAPWHEAILDPASRKLAERYNSADAMAGALVGMNKELSQRIKLPGKDASDDDVAAYRKAIGVPENPDGYAFNKPDHMTAEEFGAVMPGMKNYADSAHSAGLSQDQLNSNVQWYWQMKANETEALNKRDTDHREATLAELRKEWGKDFERNSLFADEVTPDSFKGMELRDGTLLGNHPEFVKLMADAGRLQSNGTTMLGLAGTAAGVTTQEQYDTLTSEIHAATDKGDMSLAQRLDDKRSVLSQQLHGEQGIIGASGRTL